MKNENVIALLHDKNGLQIKLFLQITSTLVELKAVFMNITPVAFHNLNFQVSVPKAIIIFCSFFFLKNELNPC